MSIIEENKTKFKEYHHEKALFRSKWYPIPISIFLCFCIYAIISNIQPGEKWYSWIDGILVGTFGIIFFWLWFYFDISHWPKRIRLTREGFTTWDPFNRERHYKWDEVKCIETSKGGILFVFNKRIWSWRNYFGVHHFLIDYDDFLRSIRIYASQLEWRPGKIHWF